MCVVPLAVTGHYFVCTLFLIRSCVAAIWCLSAVGSSSGTAFLHQLAPSSSSVSVLKGVGANLVPWFCA